MIQAGQGWGIANALRAGSSLGCSLMLSCSHHFPFPATHFLGLAKFVSKRLDIESLSLLSSDACTVHIISYARLALSVPGSQRLRPLSPGARAASPRKKCSMCCGKCASRIFHNTYYTGERRRREQAIMMKIRHTLAEASGYISIQHPVQKEIDGPGSYDRNWKDERTLAKTACSSSAYVTWGACCTIETRLLP